MGLPLVSIVVPTYNSERTLEKTLKSVKLQKYPRKKVEILLVDGGSTDGTIEIAKNYKCKILHNRKRLQVYAKHIGFIRASGKYLISLDSDEVIENGNSLRKRIEAFNKNPQVRMLMGSGYSTPEDSSFINYYINDFGDPFSFFVYGLSQNPRFYVEQLSHLGNKIFGNKDFLLLDFAGASNLPIIELSAASGMIDLEYARKEFSMLKKDPVPLTFLFYLMNQKGNYLAVTKNDNVLHYSTRSLSRYLIKISSRVKNNVFQTTMGKSGYLGREEFRSTALNVKKYLFIPYSLSLILPFLHSIYFVLTRRKLLYFIHTILCVYTVSLILYFYTLKILKLKTRNPDVW